MSEGGRAADGRLSERLGASPGSASARVATIRRISSSPRALLWAPLVPLFFLLHPYWGLMQDARIYVGRGMADRDVAGVGQDILFLHDGQTGFSVMRVIVDLALAAATPGAVSMALAFAGELAWLAGAAALACGVARGRVAWAALVCAMVLPSDYDGYGIMHYVESIATPRLFAEAGVLGAFAALLAGRPATCGLLLAVAALFHPLMALPGVAFAAVLLIRRHRWWLLPVGVAVCAVLAAAALGVPPLDRLARPMDAAWLATLRGRSSYLFPGLWPAESFGLPLGQAATLVAAGAVAGPRVRALLLAVAGTAGCGLLGAWLFGELRPSTLVVQAQLWRWLWPLAVLGNAALPVAAAALWRRGAAARLALALLVLARLLAADLPLAALFAAAALGLLAALARRPGLAVSPLVWQSAAVAAALIAVGEAADGAHAVVLLFRSAAEQGGAVDWPMVVGLGAQTLPLAAVALAAAIVPPPRRSHVLRWGAAAGLAGAAAAAIVLWDGRSTERRFLDAGASDAALRAAVGSAPGEVLWIDEQGESWFLLGRPDVLSGAQAGPILFSRDLAVEWSERIALLLRLGLARPEDAAPWGRVERSTRDLALTAGAVEAFCADRRRPAALVAPGDQREAVPPGFETASWRPPEPIVRLVAGPDGPRWRRLDLFTIVRCGGRAPDGPPAARP